MAFLVSISFHSQFFGKPFPLYPIIPSLPLLMSPMGLKITNRYINSLLGQKWLISKEKGLEALFRYLSDCEILSSGESVREYYRDRKEKFKPVFASVHDNYYESENDEGQEPEFKNRIAVLSFEGVMTKRGGLSTKGTDDLCRELDRMYQDDTVSAIVLKMDTPGGNPRASEQLFSKIRQKNKPVVGFIQSALSGGALSTAPCDYLMADGDLAEFGCIGVIASLIDDAGWMEKEGFKEIIIRATKSQDKNLSYEEALNGNTELIIEERLDPINNVFLGIMRDNRPLGSHFDAVTTGKTYFTEDAIRFGLADGKGTLKDAIEKADELARQQRKPQVTANVLSKVKF